MFKWGGLHTIHIASHSNSSLSCTKHMRLCQQLEDQYLGTEKICIQMNKFLTKINWHYSWSGFLSCVVAPPGSFFLFHSLLKIIILHAKKAHLSSVILVIGELLPCMGNVQCTHFVILFYCPLVMSSLT